MIKACNRLAQILLGASLACMPMFYVDISCAEGTGVKNLRNKLGSSSKDTIKENIPTKPTIKKPVKTSILIPDLTVKKDKTDIKKPVVEKKIIPAVIIPNLNDTTKVQTPIVKTNQEIINDNAETATDNAIGVSDADKEIIKDQKLGDQTLKQVFDFLGELRGVNIIVYDGANEIVKIENLREIEWWKACTLIADAHGLVFTKDESVENIYKVHAPKEAKLENIVIEFLKKSDLRNITVEELNSITKRKITNQDEMDATIEKMLKQPKRYITYFSANKQPAEKVVNAIADLSGISYSFSSLLEVAVIADATKEKNGSAATGMELQKIQLSPVTMKLTQIRSVEDVLKRAATQGGLSCTLQDGTWVISPLRPEQRNLSPLVTEIFTVNFIKLDKELVEICQKLVSKRGTVLPGKNKKLIVRDSADGVEQVRMILEEMDQPVPQVLIEARFFEITDSDKKNIGMDWAFLGKNGLSFAYDPYTGSRVRETTENNNDSNKLTTTDTLSTDVATGAITGSITKVLETINPDNNKIDITKISRASILDVGQMGVVLHALKEYADARSLSNPKILVNTDQQATIHIGDQTPIIKSSVDSSGNTGVRTYELDGAFGGEMIEELDLDGNSKGQMRKYTTPKGYLDLGTKLSVRPSVKTKDEVFLKIVPELTSVTGYETLGSGENQVRYPVLFTTRVNTEFTIRSGQTIAIGGLVRNRNRETISSVPILGKLPFLKKLFSYTSIEKVRSETIIFLTVKIVPARSLSVRSGIPTGAKLIQADIEDIERQDAQGATFTAPDKSEKENVKEK